jgi:hypothetical protein
MTNKTKFCLALECAYTDLFRTDPEYGFSASRTTPGALAAKMTAGLVTGSANKDGEGIKRACKACGIKQTYKAIKTYLEAEDDRIGEIYKRRCNGIPIPIMELQKIYDVARAAIDAGQDVEDTIVSYVDSIRADKP